MSKLQWWPQDKTRLAGLHTWLQIEFYDHRCQTTLRHS